MEQRWAEYRLSLILDNMCCATCNICGTTNSMGCLTCSMCQEPTIWAAQPYNMGSATDKNCRDLTWKLAKFNPSFVNISTIVFTIRICKMKTRLLGLFLFMEWDGWIFWSI